MKTLLLVILGTIFLACSLKVLAQPQSQTATKTSAKPASTKQSSNEGERRFQENCGRCHYPPESLSPREVKAVLQHMRVRANLTAEDEKLILKYLAP